MANEFVRNLLVEQRKRAIGSILGHFDREFGSTPMRQRQEFREKVLAAVGVYHDTCLDILKASVDDGIIPNAELLNALESLHSDVRALANGKQGP